LKDLEAQIAEREEMKRRENQIHQDWWEKRKEPPFVVQPPSRPHPSQVRKKAEIHTGSMFFYIKSKLVIR